MVYLWIFVQEPLNCIPIAATFRIYVIGWMNTLYIYKAIVCQTKTNEKFVVPFILKHILLDTSFKMSQERILGKQDSIFICLL